MTKPSLSAIYRQATAGRESGIAAEDVVRLAAGESLGRRHDAAVEALAGSPAALVAFRAARVLGDARPMPDGRVLALPSRQSAWRPTMALAAGVMGLAIIAGFLTRLEPTVPGQPGPTVATTGAEEDVIFRVSYESQATTAGRQGEAIFVDEFDG